MATIAAEPRVDGADFAGAHLLSWLTMGAGDVGSAIKYPGSADKTIHALGDFGAGGSLTIRGSNLEAPNVATATDWFAMSDAGGVAIALTAAGGAMISEAPLWISPLLTGGTSPDVDVYILVQARKR